MNISKKIKNFLKNKSGKNNQCQYSYIKAEDTVKAANSEGLSVSDYVEKLWGQQGQTDKTVEQLLEVINSNNIKNILEIGPGTGRYLERIIRKLQPDNYEIYEVASDWNKYLRELYGDELVIREADGVSLDQTATKSSQLVHAHGVFVYLSYIHAFRYFTEMCRVCDEGGYIAFDYYSAKEMSVDVIKRNIQSGTEYAVVLDGNTIEEFFNKNSCYLISEFLNKHGQGYSRYCIYQKKH